MKLNHDANRRLKMLSVPMLAGVMLAVMLFARSISAQTADSKSAEEKAALDTYQTLYLTNVTQQDAANDVTTDLRNMIPRAKVYYVPFSGAISLRGTPDDIQLAQKILVDLDRSKKTYRLTYTITETDNGKHLGTQHFSLIAVSGGKAMLKQGSRVPIVTGTAEVGSSAQNSQVQYLDVGLNVEASLEGYSDGLRLRTKVEQSSVAEEKSGLGAQDPIVRQTTLEGTSILVQGKPSIVGSLDIPGSTRHQEIEVVSELVR
jgi:type II secretory pathway component GspD/PulD (secretin)